MSVGRPWGSRSLLGPSHEGMDDRLDPQPRAPWPSSLPCHTKPFVGLPPSYTSDTAAGPLEPCELLNSPPEVITAAGKHTAHLLVALRVSLSAAPCTSVIKTQNSKCTVQDYLVVESEGTCTSSLSLHNFCYILENRDWERRSHLSRVIPRVRGSPALCTTALLRGWWKTMAGTKDGTMIHETIVVSQAPSWKQMAHSKLEI